MQKKILIGLALTLVIVLFISLYWATESERQEAARERQQAEAVERGAELYTVNCAVCHGPTGEGIDAPALKDNQLDADIMKKIIARGISGTEMPAWSVEEGGTLKKHQIEDIVTFIKNWDQSLIESSPAPTPPAVPSPAPALPSEWKPVESLDDIKYDPNTPDNILLSGKSTFQSSCSACHDLPSVQRIKAFASDEALLRVEISMTKLANLPMDYSEKVIRYLIAVRHDTAP